MLKKEEGRKVNVHMKKPLSMGFVAMLVLSVAIFTIPTGQTYENNPAPAIWLDPNWTDTLEVCDSFKVSIVVNITDPPGPGTGLYMWEYELAWNTSWISLVGLPTTVHPGKNLGWGTPGPDLIWDTADDILNYTIAKNTVGPSTIIPGLTRHWYAVSALAPAVAFVGVHWLCNYTFHVDDAPIQPASDYNGIFPFHLEALADDKVTHIVTPDDWTIGTYTILATPAPKPRLEVRPKKTSGVCGENFNISIAIYNLVKEWNLWGWEAKLKYDPAYVCALASYEGPFLPSFVSPAHPNATSYINILNYTADTILMAGSFNDPNHTTPQCPGAYGTVSILMFNAFVQTIAPDIVTTAFGIFDVELAGVFPNGTVYEIPMTDPPVVNGTYNVPWKCCYPRGDVNYDGKVNIIDIGICCKAFGSTPSDPRWDPRTDLNQDGIIDIFDLILIAVHFGKEEY